MDKLKSYILVYIILDRFKLNDDLEVYLLYYDFEFFIYDEIEEYLEDFFEINKIDWYCLVFYKIIDRYVYYLFDM